MKINLSHQTLPQEELISKAKKISSSSNELLETLESKKYTKPESFIFLPFDEDQIIKLIEFKKNYTHKDLKKIVVIGIGGSIQGTRAVYQLLKKHKNLIAIDFLDHINSENAEECLEDLKNLKPEEYLIFVITKSGSTTETLYNLELLENNFQINSDRLIFITEENSHLISICESKKYKFLTIPKKISGRFSVFSMVGLAPLALSGVNIIKLLEGAMGEINNINEVEENLAIQAAVSKYLSKRIINENLYPSKHFGELGKWEKQLFNESLGKTENAIFTSFGNFFIELHSSLQHYLNSKNVFLNTLYVKENKPLSVAETELLPKNFYQTDSEEINIAIHTSVIRSLEKNNIPTITIELEHLDEKEIGSYLQFKMLEVYYLCKLNDVNPFDQPEVQEYKQQLYKYI